MTTTMMIMMIVQTAKKMNVIKILMETLNDVQVFMNIVKVKLVEIMINQFKFYNKNVCFSYKLAKIRNCIETESFLLIDVFLFSTDVEIERRNVYIRFYV